MAWRDGGEKTRTERVEILTCDHCGRDIGHPSGYGSRAHYEVRIDWPDPYSDEGSRDFCSAECLLGAAQAVAAGESRILEKIEYKP